MSEQLPGHLRAPITQRSASELSHRYGFASVAEMANYIPSEGRVLDVGAGHSPLGQEIAQRRPDITWYNFDYSYRPDFVAAANRLAPNVRYVGGDVLELAGHFEPHTFDNVFSYWLIPHLGIEGPEVTKGAVAQLYTVAKNNSEIFLGPDFRRMWMPRDTHRWVKTPELTAEHFASNVDAKIGVHGLLRFLMLSLNLPEERSPRERSRLSALTGDATSNPWRDFGATLKLIAQQNGILFGTLAQYPFQKAYVQLLLRSNERIARQEENGMTALPRIAFESDKLPS